MTSKEELEEWQYQDVAFNTGKLVERERIIKLLDTECECEHDHYCAYHRAIAIILEEDTNG
jgi:acetyl-CoA carboxylase carboxyltransferase component